MEELQAAEIGVLQHIQASFYHWDQVMLFLSRAGDPRYAFLIYFPVAFCLSRALGLRVVWAAVAAEWLNAILKWLMHGQRPYWWVHETKFYSEEDRPTVDQFELTCETGPGCPSGHVMVTTTVWFVMMSALAQHIQSRGQNSANGITDAERFLGRLPWLFLVVLTTGVCVSRVYIATHFPHQVLLGAICGITLGQVFIRLHLESISFGRYIFFSAFFFLSIYGEYAFLCGLNFDPQWTINLAKKWCAEKEWLHLDTTLFYCVARDVGVLAFLGLSELLPLTVRDRSGQYVLKLVTAVLCLLFALGIEGFHLPRDNLYVFYVLGGCKYGLVSLGTVCTKFMMFKVFSSNVFVCFSSKVKNG